MLIYDESNYENTAFELGWDFATYGLKCYDEISKEFLDGYNAAKQKRVHRVADSYILKWLYLRANALKRKRVVAKHVTPMLIRLLIHSYCPITLSNLTVSLCQDTDWSIDRLNNNGGYAVGNLCVVSTKANLAKGSLDSKGIKLVLQQMKEERLSEFNGLTSPMWRRMLWLTEKGEGMDDQLMMLAPIPMVRVSKTDRLCFYLALLSIFRNTRQIALLKRSLGANYFKLKRIQSYIAMSLDTSIYDRFSELCEDSYFTNMVKEFASNTYLLNSALRAYKEANKDFNALRGLDWIWDQLDEHDDEIKETWRLDSNGYMDKYVSSDNVKITKMIEQYYKRSDRICSAVVIDRSTSSISYAWRDR